MDIYQKGNNTVVLKCTVISSTNIYLLFPHKGLAQNAQRRVSCRFAKCKYIVNMPGLGFGKGFRLTKSKTTIISESGPAQGMSQR